MAAKRLDASAVGLPVFPVPAWEGEGEPRPFGFTSHARAREALEFGLSIPDAGFNIFVLGEDRSGRMTATLDYLRAHVAGRPPPSDWIYLNEFNRRGQPRAYRLPAGQGRRFRDRMQVLLPSLREALRTALSGQAYEETVATVARRFHTEMAAAFEELQAHARGRGVEVRQAEKGVALLILGPDGQPRDPDSLSDEERDRLSAASVEVESRMRALNHKARTLQADIAARVRELRRETAEEAVSPLIDGLQAEFGAVPRLSRWLVRFRSDVSEHVEAFLHDPESGESGPVAPEQRYGVNLLVEQSEDGHPSVVLEPNPTYENLFGSIQYRAASGVLMTDVTMIRAGALHRANGGILVLRADALVSIPGVWGFLKAALRDGEIRIEELHRQGGVPMAGAPSPEPVPLSVKLVLVGQPRWYYAMLAGDPEFQSLVKVKADIDPDMEAEPANLALYAQLLRARASCPIEDEAVAFLLGYCARWANNRQRLSARFEAVQDIVAEAEAMVEAPARLVTAAMVRDAISDRRRRNARVEDRVQESIRDGVVMIDIDGAAVGQVNALTVRDYGDHAFGTPARITARTYVGRLGIINIERMIALGGPIQQKGVLVLEGFANGRFARRFPLSFSCSVTFEQSYGGVEGDSASLAELCAILSSLAEAPIRQDLAITGSVDQLGAAQAVGGVDQKIEGFYRTCLDRGLSGRQGVIIPAANERHVTLRPEVADAVAAGRFHVWSVATVDEAAALLTGLEAGEADASGAFAPHTLYGRVLARLAEYDRILTVRATHRD